MAQAARVGLPRSRSSNCYRSRSSCWGRRRATRRPPAPTSGCSRRASSSRTSTAAGRWRSARRSRRRARTCSSTPRRCAAPPRARDEGRGLCAARSRASSRSARAGDAGRPRPASARSGAPLRPARVWWMCERARRKLMAIASGTRGTAPDATMQTADFGVFIDFMSPVPAGRHGGAKPAYTHAAGGAGVVRRALRNIGLLYGHAGTVVFKMTSPSRPTATRSRLRAARVDAPRAAPRRPRGAGVEQPRRGGVADGRGGARRPGGDCVLSKGPDGGAARRRSCASRRRSSPRRATTTNKRDPGTLGALIRGGGARRAGEPRALRGGAR